MEWRVVLIMLIMNMIRSDAVCDEQTLITELKQDIADNGKLDCLREVRDAPTDKEENEEEKKKRIAAAWDTDCSFEAEYDWMRLLKDIHGLEKGLVDANGDSVKTDFEDQADMCEIVRGMIAAGLVKGAKPNVKEIDEDSVDAIDCPGNGDAGQSEICAVTGYYSIYHVEEGHHHRITVGLYFQKEYHSQLMAIHSSKHHDQYSDRI